MWSKEQNMNVVLFWLPLLLLMDNYRIKIQCDLTANKNHKLRGNTVQCLSRWAFKERTYRRKKTTDCNMALENRKQSRRSRLLQLLRAKSVLNFSDIPLRQQQAGRNVNAPEHFNSLKNPVTWKTPFSINQGPAEQWVRALANYTKMTDSCNYQSLQAELICDRIMIRQKSRRTDENA